LRSHTKRIQPAENLSITPPKVDRETKMAPSVQTEALPEHEAAFWTNPRVAVPYKRGAVEGYMPNRDAILTERGLAWVPNICTQIQKANGRASYGNHVLQGLHPFLADYLSLPEARRNHYEVVPRNAPCKLFLDVDLDDEKPGYTEVRETYDAETEPALIAAIEAHLRTLFPGLPPIAPPMVLDATTPSKVSRHYVWEDVLFRTIDEIKRFVASLCASGSPLVERLTEANILDCGVYTMNRNFRLLGSTKLGKANWLRLLRPAGLPFCEAVQRTMLTVYAKPRFMLTGVEAKKRRSTAGARLPPSKRTSGLTGEVTYATLSPSERALTANFERAFGGIPSSNHPGSNIATKTTRHHQWFFGGVCPNKGTEHRSNKIAFKLNLGTMEGWFHCMDPDCRNHKWDRKNYRYVTEAGAFRYHGVFIDESWYRPLEAFIAEAVQKPWPDALVKSVEFCPFEEEVSIACAIDPNPCRVHKHAPFSPTKLVVVLKHSGRHTGYWTCCGFGAHPRGELSAEHAGLALLNAIRP